MTTKVQKLAESLSELRAELDTETKHDNADPFEWQKRVVKIAKQLDALEPDVLKMKSKIAEVDPDKRMYGPAMTEKVTALHANFASLKEEVDGLYPGILLAIANHRREQKAVPSAAEQREDADVPEAAAAAAAAGPQASGKLAAEHRQFYAAPSSEAEAGNEGHAKEGLSSAGMRAHTISSDQPHEFAAKAGANLWSLTQQAPIPAAKAGAGATSPTVQASGSEAQGKGRSEEVLHKEVCAGKIDKQEDVADDDKEIAASSARLAALRQQWRDKAKAGGSTTVNPKLPNGSPFTATGGGPELLQILQAAQAAGRTVVVDFNTSWCGPCKAMKPLLSQLAAEYRGKVSIVMVDCEQSPANRSLATEAAIRAFPTFHIYHGLDRKQHFQGGRPPHAFRHILDQHLASFPPAATFDVSMINALVESLKQLQQATPSDADFAAACQNHPGEPKYRRIKASNRRLSDALLSRPGGSSCLAAAGFSSISEAGEQVFIGDVINSEMVDVCLPLLGEASSYPAAFKRFLMERPTEQPVPASTHGVANQRSESIHSDISSLGPQPSAAGTELRPSPLATPQRSTAQPNEQSNAWLAAQLAQMLSQVQVPETSRGPSSRP